MRRDDILRVLARFRDLKQDEFGIVRIGVFGSFAREGNTEASDGETERYAVTSGLTLNTDDVIQVMTGTGAGCTLSPNPKGGLV